MSQTHHDTTAPSAAISLLAAELMRLAEAHETADRRARRAGIYGGDRQPDEDARLDALGAFFGLESQMAHLELLLLRLAAKHESDALRQRLAEALRPEFVALWEAVARLEARR